MPSPPKMPLRQLELGAINSFAAFATNPVSNQIKVSRGWLSKSLPNAMVLQPEQTTVAFNPVSVANRVRWDLVYLNENGQVFVIQGTEQVTPVADFTGAPAPPRNTSFPVALIKVVETTGVAISTDDIEDIRPPYHFYEQTPVGSIQMSLGSVIPSGWLAMNGNTIGKSGSGATHTGEIFRELFNILKNIAPNVGTENFDANQQVIIPNSEGRFPIAQKASDTDFDTLGETGGAKTANLQHTHDIASAIMGTSGDHTHGVGNHTHTIANSGTHTHSGTALASNNVTGNGLHPAGLLNHSHDLSINADGNHNHGGNTGGSSGTTDAGGNHTHTLANLPNALSATQSIMPPFMAFKFIIKY